MLARVHVRIVRVFIAVNSFIVAASLENGRAFELARHRFLGTTQLESQSQQASTITSDADVNHTLIICNAYANTAPLSVSQVRTHTRVTDGAIRYKACVTAEVALEDGDQLDFNTQQHVVGTFFATGLPKEPTTLVIIPHRRGPSTLAATFKSHAFSSSAKAQLVIVDAFAGRPGRSLKITDVRPDNAGNHREAFVQRTEDLAYNQVLAVTPGAYRLSMTSNETGVAESKKAIFVSLNVSVREQVVVARIGSESNEGDQNKYPPELLVFAHTAGAASILRRGVGTGLVIASVVFTAVTEFSRVRW